LPYDNIETAREKRCFCARESHHIIENTGTEPKTKAIESQISQTQTSVARIREGAARKCQKVEENRALTEHRVGTKLNLAGGFAKLTEL